jgi:uncharacterized protein YajQ (UPF0234 family)
MKAEFELNEMVDVFNETLTMAEISHRHLELERHQPHQNDQIMRRAWDC